MGGSVITQTAFLSENKQRGRKSPFRIGLGELRDDRGDKREEGQKGKAFQV